MSILTVENLRKVYSTRFGGNQVEALKNVNFSVDEGEYVAIMGESGSGKTTLLNHSCGAGQADRRHGRARRQGSCQDQGDPTLRPSAATISALCFRSLTCWTRSRYRTTSCLPLVLAGKSYDEMHLAPAADSDRTWA